MSQQRDLSVSRVLSLLAWVILFYLAWNLFFGGLGLGMGLGVAAFGALIVILLKLLFLFFVIALVISLFKLVKRVLFPETGKSLKEYNEPLVSKVKEKCNVLTNKTACPGCYNTVSNNYIYCPYCATQLRQICGRCGVTLEPGWKCCPHCGPQDK